MIRFRIYPEVDKPLFFDARVYKTARLMRAAIYRDNLKMGYKEDERTTNAMCRVFTHYCPVANRTKPQLGILFFQEGWLDEEIVAHEMFHATMAWAHRKRVSRRQTWMFGTRQHEDFAYCVGRLTRQFWNNYRGFRPPASRKPSQ